MMDLKERWRELIDSLVGMDGRSVRIERYSVSHRTLELHVRSNSGETLMDLRCLACSWLCGPVEWKGCRLRVTFSADAVGTLIELIDETCGARVVCRRIEYQARG